MDNGEHPSRDKTPTGTSIPQIDSRYELSHRIGTGGMGEVYRAWDTLLRRWVAIKRLRPQGPEVRDQRARLLREARAISSLNHPAIVQVYDVLEREEEALLVQELVEGTPLRLHLGQPCNWAFFLRFARDCAAGLVAAAEKSIVHCDLKPENILVTDGNHACILDFGIACHFTPPALARPDEPTARASQESEPATTTITDHHSGISGTPAYLSPERIAGLPPDGRTDIFSLGLIFYEMLTGHHPFLRSTLAATLVAIDRDTPPQPSALNPQLPRAVDDLIMSMLGKDREERLATPQELLTRLEHLEEETGTAAVRRKRARARTVGLALAGTLAVVLGVWGGVDRWGLRKAETSAPPVPYLAVQPFDNLSADPADVSFARGMMEAVQIRLAALDGIQVVDANAHVGARYALGGTLQRSEDELRITYRLLDRNGGLTLAGGFVVGGVGEIFALQDQLTNKVGQDLATHFELGSLPEPGTRPTLDVTAYDYYLQARGYLQSPRGHVDYEIALQLFQKALSLDPRFTLALAGTGEASWKMYAETKDPVWAVRAEEVSRRAQAQNPDLPEVHMLLGTIFSGTGKSALAVGEFRRVLEINPRDTAAYRGLGWALADEGDIEAAEQAFIEAIRTRPTDWASHSHLGAFYSRLGRTEDALLSFQKVIELTPDNARGYRNLAGMLQRLGRFAEATTAYERSLELMPDYRTYSNLATLHRSQGRLEEAARNYQMAIDISDQNCLVWGNLASIYAMIPGREALADSVRRCAIERGEAQLAVNPNDALLLALLGQYHIMVGEPTKGRDLIGRALEAAPGRPDILYYASAAYESLGDRELALETARDAMRAGYPPDAWRQEPSVQSLVSDPEFERIARAVSNTEWRK